MNTTTMSPSGEPFLNGIEKAGLMPVLVIHEAEQALPLLACLMENGMTAVEVAWRTPDFLPMLTKIRREFPGLLLGVGTVLTSEQVWEAHDAGADFGLSPGISRVVVEAAAGRNWPFVPGVMTPSDIQLAVDLRCRLLKFFPAETAGGAAHLRAMVSPFLHLGLRFIVLGGVGPDNIGSYGGESHVAAIGGSWIASPKHIEARDWKGIGLRMREALDLVRNESAATRNAP